MEKNLSIYDIYVCAQSGDVKMNVFVKYRKKILAHICLCPVWESKDEYIYQI